MNRVLLLAILMLGCLAPVSATAAQIPIETTTMLSHQARFTAEIPSDWGVDRSQRTTYASADGEEYIQATTFSLAFQSLTSACEVAQNQFGAYATVTWITFQRQLACRIEAQSGANLVSDPVVLIFQHPKPLRSGVDGQVRFRYARVTIDREHFDEVSSTIRFDLGDVTPQLYLESAIDLIETYAIVRDEIDWVSVRREAQAAIQGDDPAPGIDLVLAALAAEGDDHSYRWSPIEFDTYAGTTSSDIPDAELPMGLAFPTRSGTSTCRRCRGTRVSSSCMQQLVIR